MATHPMRSILCCLAGLLLNACNRSHEQQPAKSTFDLTSAVPVEAPKTDDSQTKKIAQLQVALFQLQLRVEQLESGEAGVSTEEEGYGIAKTNFGAFTVSAKSVAPYLDGYKVKLTLGNLTSATFNGAKITVSWGLPYDEKNLEAYASSQKHKEFDVTARFPYGTFTDVEVALTPAKPEEIKALSVGVQLNQISMRLH